MYDECRGAPALTATLITTATTSVAAKEQLVPQQQPVASEFFVADDVDGVTAGPIPELNG